MSPWFVLLGLLAPPGSCRAIHADQITGEDLARAVSAFTRIPRDVVIANSPVPGNQRIFAGPELQRLAKQYAVDLPGKSSACFEWRMRVISAADVTAAIRESFPAESVRVEVLAIGKANAPEGKLVFPLSGLSASANVDANTPVSWRGEVVYDGSHKFTVWARVRLSATITRVITREMLLPGRTVDASQIALETLDSFPLRSNAARSLDEVTGRSPLRAIKPGTPVLRADLAEPLQIRRGESVLVMAVAGAAQLRMEAIAENSGKQGDVITLRNPRSGKSFRARIEGHDQALVIAGPVAELTGIQ